MRDTTCVFMDELPSIEQETLLRELMEQFHKVAVTRYGSDSEQAQTSRRLLAAEARLIADTITLE